eukprot:gnl/MRDRNA2_/MRDRNA2_77957_c0_seq1.p1 gnl/MRDRNA2_/MRDRNA2_77957_c0~~gnl/MRDRNA2_/MRDRNA2_77957_c0_seq1.p1  ORF type:complete len:210 (-),score=29.45 gnl/MRDRNA2_/MRDRNA2_77957_c0_seq1:64-693(-)
MADWIVQQMEMGMTESKKERAPVPGRSPSKGSFAGRSPVRSQGRLQGSSFGARHYFWEPSLRQYKKADVKKEESKHPFNAGHSASPICDLCPVFQALENPCACWCTAVLFVLVWCNTDILVASIREMCNAIASFVGVFVASWLFLSIICAIGLIITILYLLERKFFSAYVGKFSRKDHKDAARGACTLKSVPTPCGRRSGEEVPKFLNI